MKYLVTGGTGFIGRPLVRRIVQRHGADAVVCLVLSPRNADEAHALDEFRRVGVRILETDLRGDPICAEAPPPVDAVFHLAAEIRTDASEHELRINDLGTRRLLDWLAPVSAGARVLYTSSIAVHDRAGEPSGPLSEASPFAPRTAYGRTKLRGEAILRAHAERGLYTWTIVRLPTVYGPGQKRGGLFDTLNGMITRGDWLGRIDWPGRTSVIHVEDAVDAMLDLARDPSAAGGVYCLASDDHDLRVGDISHTMASIAGRSGPDLEIPARWLRLARRVVWSRWIHWLVPQFAHLSFWRLSLILSDGFWFDNTEFRRVYRKPLRNLEQGLREMLATPASEEHLRTPTARAPITRLDHRLSCDQPAD